MNNTLIYDNKNLKRIPPVFIFILILILGLPAVGLNYFAIDFNALSRELESFNSSHIPSSEIKGFFIQVLLQWSAFSLAAITTLLAFTQYRLVNDKIAFVIGLSILFSGTVEALHTLVVDTPPYLANKSNVDALIWTSTNSISGLILIIGSIVLLKSGNKKMKLKKFHLLSVLLFCLALAFIYYSAYILPTPTMWFKNDVFSRPYDLIYTAIYLSIAGIFYPRLYNRYPTILTNCIFYMAITQIVIAVYFIAFSEQPYDLAYNVAFFLKIVVYFIPFSCLIINYVSSYNSILQAQIKLEESQEKLKYYASHDSLTNLYNRREFENLLYRSIANNAREFQTFALLLIDIDNFKLFNDTLGHIHGDNFLKKFAEELTLITRKGDILSRIGGDEFTVITPRLPSPTSARKIASRLIKGLTIPYSVSDRVIESSVSIGVAIYPMDGDNIDDLVKHADIALYNAKKTGKKSYRFYTEKVNFHQHREAQIENLLQSAIEKNEFSIFFQPQYNLINKEIIGAEILLRWHNQELGNITPDEFIPIAENNNSIIAIGNWVLNQTFKQAKEWLEKYHKALFFSINVSPVQFENNNFFQDLKKNLEAYNYPAKNIGIEITENLLMKNNELVHNSLRNINDLGIEILLDDFGVGYSSLSRLQALPINTIKIDKLFIADIQNEVKKIIIVDMIIKLAHELEMDLIAEGIETPTQLNYLINRKCIFGQGFYLSKPIPASEFEKLVFKNKL